MGAKNMVIGGALLLLGACSTKKEPTKFEQNTISFQETLLPMLKKTPEKNTYILELLKQPPTTPIAENNRQLIHDLLMSKPQNLSPADIGDLILSLLYPRELMDSVENISQINPEVLNKLYDNARNILLQSGVYYDEGAIGNTNGIFRIDSIATRPVDTVVFKKIFGPTFDMDKVEVAYANMPKNASGTGSREGTNSRSTIILNPAGIKQSATWNNTYFIKTNQEQYARAVLHNEAIHAYMYQKYGLFSILDAFPLGKIVVKDGEAEYSPLYGVEYLSDVAAIMTDFSYFTSPLLITVGNLVKQQNTKPNYIISEHFIINRVLPLFTDQPELQQTLNDIITDGIREYENTSDEMEKELVSEKAAQKYCAIFLQNLQPHHKEYILSELLQNAHSIVKQFEDIKKQVQ